MKNKKKNFGFVTPVDQCQEQLKCRLVLYFRQSVQPPGWQTSLISNATASGGGGGGVPTFFTHSFSILILNSGRFLK